MKKLEQLNTRSHFVIKFQNFQDLAHDSKVQTSESLNVTVLSLHLSSKPAWSRLQMFNINNLLKPGICDTKNGNLMITNLPTLANWYRL